MAGPDTAPRRKSRFSIAAFRTSQAEEKLWDLAQFSDADEEIADFNIDVEDTLSPTLEAAADEIDDDSDEVSEEKCENSASDEGVFVEENLSDTFEATAKENNEDQEGAIKNERQDFLQKHKFVLEMIESRTLTIIILAVYAVFIFSLVIEILKIQAIPFRERPFSIVTVDAQGDDYVCSPRSNGICEADSKLNLAQATLLANTIVVSDSINVTDWDGDKAKPNSPPFNAKPIDDSRIIMNSSFLDYEANPQNHDIWDNITAVVWSGQASSDQLDLRTYFLDVQFEKTSGDWPPSLQDELFPVRLESYACVRGKNCSSVGDWRVLSSYGNKIHYPAISVDKNILSSRFAVITPFISPEIIETIGVRLIILSDPAEAVTACLTGVDCIASLKVTGIIDNTNGGIYATLVIFIIYIPFFAWWIYRLRTRCGPFAIWEVEHKLLLLGGVGFILTCNPLYISVSIRMITDKDYVFQEWLWMFAFTTSFLGTTIVMFVFACFVDAPRWFVASNFSFYGGKALYCVIFLISGIVPMIYHFPSVTGSDQPGTQDQLGRVGVATALQNWDRNDQIVYTCFMFVGFVCLFFAFVYYAFTMRKTLRVLGTLPYGMTRHTQLSTRFFFWVTSLWLLVEWMQIIADIVNDVKIAIENDTDQMETLTGFATVLDRVDFFDTYRSVYNLSFSLVFWITFQFLFLPPLDALKKEKKTHYISEEESEGDGIQGLPTYLMILDLAQLLLVCSREVYLPFDDEQKTLSPKEKQKESTVSAEDGSNKNMPVATSSSAVSDSSAPRAEDRTAGDAENSPCSSGWESSWSLGCRVVARISEPAEANIHDTRVVIFRHIESGDLIVSFRGTKTEKQVKTDLMTSKVAVTLDSFLTASQDRRIGKKKEKRIHPEVLEAKIKSKEITKVRLIDLTYNKDDDELPDYLNTSYLASDKVHGRGKIHFGFWSSYNRVRKQLHLKIRENLEARPGRVLLTGHSLGGAQAILCAYDMCKWVVPTVRRQLIYTGGRRAADLIKVSCYTFGSPVTGNKAFTDAYNKVVPDTQRIVVDGDIITMSHTFLGYHHVGRENLVDKAGSVRVDRPLIERQFSKGRTQPSAHFVNSYYTAVKNALNPMMSEVKILDTLRVAYGLQPDYAEVMGRKSQMRRASLVAFD